MLDSTEMNIKLIPEFNGILTHLLNGSSLIHTLLLHKIGIVIKDYFYIFIFISVFKVINDIYLHRKTILILNSTFLVVELASLKHKPSDFLIDTSRIPYIIYIDDSLFEPPYILLIPFTLNEFKYMLRTRIVSIGTLKVGRTYPYIIQPI